MIPVSLFIGKNVAVFGLAASGLSAARALHAGGARVFVDDDDAVRRERALAEGFSPISPRNAQFDRFAALVLAPGVPLTHPAPHPAVRAAREAGIEIIGDIELFSRMRRAAGARAGPLIAITGTNGKSTTTALLTHLITQAGRDAEAGGNLGTPALDLSPFSPRLSHVIECSSFQIDLTPSLHPTIGVHLNLSPDHLDRHGDFDAYARIKERLVAAADFAVVGVDDPASTAIAERREADGCCMARVSVTQPIVDGVYLDESVLAHAHGGRRETIVDLGACANLRGVHNAQNAAAAAAVALRLGVSRAAIAAGLKSFPGLAHRMQIVGRRGGVVFVNDSKATNADAAARALASFKRVHWIVGGRPKAGGINALGDFFSRIDKAYLIGEAADAFAATLAGKVEAVVAGDVARAVECAARDAAEAAVRSGDETVVLLSPACASFDQFANFEARGRAFVDAVARLDKAEKYEEKLW